MKTARLGDLCAIQSGGTPRREEHSFYGGPIPWAKIGDLETADAIVRCTEESLTEKGLAAIRGRIFQPGTVLLAMYGSVGKVAVAGTAMATNQAILGIQVTHPAALSPEYLRRWLEQIRDRLIFDARGVTQQNISATLVRDLRIPLPPLAEQRRIAAVLDRADAIRRKGRESLRLLGEFLRSAFLQLFGDPVRNEKGWEVRKLGDVVRDAQYGTSQKANSDGRGISTIRMNNLTPSGDIDLSELKWCEVPDPDLPNYTVRRGDVLFNRTNSPELVGKTAVWDRDERYAFAGYLVRLRLDENRMLPHYLSGFLNSAYGKQLLLATARPSINMSNISASRLLQLRIPVPSLIQQKRYAALIGAVREAQHKRQEALNKSERLFGALSQRLFRAGR